MDGAIFPRRPAARPGTAAPDAEALAQENLRLRARLQEAEDTLRALRAGEVEGLVVETSDGPRVFTLTSAAEASDRLRGEMLARVGDAVVAADADGRIAFLNAAAERLYGAPADQVLGRETPALYGVRWPDGAERSSVARHLAAHGAWRGETVHRTREGREIHVEASLTILPRDGALPSGSLAVIRDVTPRKRAEQRLSLQVAVTRALGESDSLEEAAPRVLAGMGSAAGVECAALWRLPPGGATAECIATWGAAGPDAAAWMKGAEGALPIAAFAALPGADGTPGWRSTAGGSDRMGRAAAQGLRGVLGIPIQAGGQMLGLVELYGSAGTPPEAAMLAVLAAAGDQIGLFLQRQQAVERLSSRETHLRLALEAAGATSFEWDVEHQQLQGLDSGDPGAGAAIPEVDAGRFVANLRAALESPDGTYRSEQRVVGPGGDVHWIDERGRLERDARGRPLRLIGVSHDVTHRRRQEEALRESEWRLRLLGDNLPDSFVYQYAREADGTERYIYMSAGIERLLGLTVEEVLADPGVLHARIEPEALARLQEARQRSSGDLADIELEIPLRGAGGERRWMRLQSRPHLEPFGRVVWDGVQTDVTQHKAAVQAMQRAEEELRLHREHLRQLVDQRTAELEASHERLRMSERMASIGTLAAGLGHDMGNLLMPMRVRLETLETLGLDPRARAEVEGIRASAEYLRRLAAGLRLLALDSSGRGDQGPTEIGSWWAETEAVFRNGLPRGIALESDLGDCRGAWIPMSRPALTQAVFNLVQNAGDAMKAQGRGTIVLSGERAGERLRLTVADTGPGMSEEIRRRCMEPFFTTKSRGVSTGLGLTLVYGLVHEAGGAVELRSGDGEGTAFTISLPLRSPPAPGGPRRQAYVDIGDPRLRGFVAGELRSLSYRILRRPDELGPEDLVVAEPGGGARHPGRVVRLPAGARFGMVKALLHRLAGADARGHVGGER